MVPLQRVKGIRVKDLHIIEGEGDFDNNIGENNPTIETKLCPIEVDD